MPYKFTVMVDDNFNYMDTSERYKAGEYKTYDEAVSKCKAIVDEFLEDSYKKGMTLEELLNFYMLYGEDPFILGESEHGYLSVNYLESAFKHKNN